MGMDRESQYTVTTNFYFKNMIELNGTFIWVREIKSFDKVKSSCFLFSLPC